MTVYFVRHGESQGNQKKVHQTAAEPLSEIGLDQAKLVAHRFTKIKFEALLASPYRRAQQTAQIISGKTKVRVETYEEFREPQRPPEIQGLPHQHPKAVKVRALVKKHLLDPDWHYSTEENFFDVKQRAKNAFHLLERRREQSIAVVSHGNFIALMITIKLFGQDIEPDRFLNMFAHTKYSNTGITVMDYSLDEYSKQKEWKLVTFNDNAHLG